MARDTICEEWVRMELCLPYERNPRTHGKKQIRQLQSGLLRYGQVKPIVVQEDPDGVHFRIFAGHGFTTAATGLRDFMRETGNVFWDVVSDHVKTNLLKGLIWAVILPSTWTEEQCVGYMLIDNRAGEDDEEMLLHLWQEQHGEGYDFSTFGTTEEDYLVLLAEHQSPLAKQEVDRPTMVPADKKAKQVAVVLPLTDIEVLEQAIRKTGLRNRGDAVTHICKTYLERVI